MLSYLSDDPDILPEAGWEALGTVLGIAEVVEAPAVQIELQTLEEQGELKDGDIGSSQGSFLKGSCESQQRQ